MAIIDAVEETDADADADLAATYHAHAHTLGLRQHGYDDEAIAEILGTVALWNEVTRFNIGARIHWPYQSTATGEEAA